MKPEGNISEFDLWVRTTVEQGSTPPPPGAWEGIQSSVQGATPGSTGIVDAIRQLIVKQAAWKTAAIAIGGAAITGLTAVLLVSPTQEKTIIDPVQNQSVQSKPQEEIKPENNLSKTDTEEINGSQTSDKPLYNTNGTSYILNQGSIPTSNVGTQNTINNPDPTQQLVQNIPDRNISAQPEIIVTEIGSCSKKKFELTILGQMANWWIDGQQFAQGVSKIVLSIQKPVDVLARLSDGSQLSQRLDYVYQKADFNTTHLGDGWVQLNAITQDASLIIWNIGKDMSPVYDRTEIKFRVHSNQSNPQVSMITRDQNGCTDTITKIIEADGVAFREPIIPNIFTPYVQDGYNDDFKIDMDAPQHFHLIIRNIKGETVFETRNHEEGWNGRMFNQGDMCPKGKYIYSLFYQMHSGDTETRQNSLLLN